MKSTYELLAIAKARNGDCSDYRLAKLLGVPSATVSNYRIGRTLPANPIAERLGELCGLDPARVVCWVNIERAATPEESKTWQMLLSRVSGRKSTLAHAH